MGLLKDIAYEKIKKQIVKDFPEIDMMMEEFGNEERKCFRMRGYGCNCVEMTESRIGVYLTVPPEYSINLIGNNCRIMYANKGFDSFIRLNMLYYKNDLKKIGLMMT